jgi:hypothetical protein
MAAVRLPELEKKLRLFYAYSGLNATELAKRIDRAPATLTGWIKGTATTEAELVPDDGRERLAEILVEHFRGGVDLEKARRLWLGSFEDFADAFNSTRATRFLDLLEIASRRKMLTYLSGGADCTQPIAFSNSGETPADAILANIGDRFAFRFEGMENAQIVLLVETVVGIHLGVPGPRSPSQLDDHGHALLPRYPDTYTFEEPRGLHRFWGFAIDTPRPLSISAAAGRRPPLSENELNTFAAELCDQTLVRSWLLDVLAVDVR